LGGGLRERVFLKKKKKKFKNGLQGKGKEDKGCTRKKKIKVEIKNSLICADDMDVFMLRSPYLQQIGNSTRNRWAKTAYQWQSKHQG
jgi:hypothetical protein